MKAADVSTLASSYLGIFKMGFVDLSAERLWLVAPREYLESRSLLVTSQRLDARVRLSAEEERLLVFEAINAMGVSTPSEVTLSFLEQQGDLLVVLLEETAKNGRFPRMNLAALRLEGGRVRIVWTASRPGEASKIFGGPILAIREDFDGDGQLDWVFDGSDGRDETYATVISGRTGESLFQWWGAAMAVSVREGPKDVVVHRAGTPYSDERGVQSYRRMAGELEGDGGVERSPWVVLSFDRQRHAFRAQACRELTANERLELSTLVMLEWEWMPRVLSKDQAWRLYSFRDPRVAPVSRHPGVLEEVPVWPLNAVKTIFSESDLSAGEKAAVILRYPTAPAGSAPVRERP
ncbi:MAG: hypothetical protein IT186_14805 [Acidobacteria bacterium]|nr:hypothetical protein [Acidobacteriota bacterium]